MPIYEYECENCKYLEEILQKINDAPIVKCQKCGKDTMKKIVSRSSFELKGNGWYETDFKGKKTSDNSDKKVDKNDKK